VSFLFFRSQWSEDTNALPEQQQEPATPTANQTPSNARTNDQKPMISSLLSHSKTLN
jgi:hypothetical protein